MPESYTYFRHTHTSLTWQIHQNVCFTLALNGVTLHTHSQAKKLCAWLVGKHNNRPHLPACLCLLLRLSPSRTVANSHWFVDYVKSCMWQLLVTSCTIDKQLETTTDTPATPPNYVHVLLKHSPRTVQTFQFQ